MKTLCVIDDVVEELKDAKLEVSCVIWDRALITIENHGKLYLFGQLYEKVSTRGLLQISIEEAEDLSKKLAVMAKNARRLEEAVANGECTSIADFKV